MRSFEVYYYFFLKKIDFLLSIKSMGLFHSLVVQVSEIQTDKTVLVKKISSLKQNIDHCVNYLHAEFDLMDISINKNVLINTVLTKNKFPIDYLNFDEDIVLQIDFMLHACRCLVELQKEYKSILHIETEALRHVARLATYAA